MASHLWTGARLSWVHWGSDGETKQAPFHPLLVQIKIKAILKGSACAQVIWGSVRKNPGENTSLIPIRILTDRQMFLPVSSTPSQPRCGDCLHKVWWNRNRYTSRIFMYVYSILQLLHHWIMWKTVFRDRNMELMHCILQSHKQVKKTFIHYRNVAGCTKNIWLQYNADECCCQSLFIEIAKWTNSVSLFVLRSWYYLRYWLYTYCNISFLIMASNVFLVSPVPLTYYSGPIWPNFDMLHCKCLLPWNLITFPKMTQNAQKFKYFKMYFWTGATNVCSLKLFRVKFDLSLLTWLFVNIILLKYI